MKKCDLNENGRSMIEMLGVLAIIGVLSVGGIAGYSKAMMKYRINKTIEQITLIAGNVHTFFASQRNYNDLVSAGHNQNFNLIKKAKLVPEEMIDENNYITDVTYNFKHHLFNAFGGYVALWHDKYTDDLSDRDEIKYFQIVYTKLPQEACIDLATQNWFNTNPELRVMHISKNEDLDWPGLTANPIGKITQSYISACYNCSVSFPIALDLAADACNCPNDDCTIVWGFK